MEDDKFLQLVVTEIREISKEQKEMGKTLASQETNLREHMRRTELNEKAIETLVDTLSPIQKHVSHVEGALKLLGAIGVIAAFVLTVIQIIKSF